MSSQEKDKDKDNGSRGEDGYKKLKYPSIPLCVLTDTTGILVNFPHNNCNNLSNMITDITRKENVE